MTTKAGHGKFSVYFVIFATVLALGIFAYSLVRLIRQCQRDKYKSYERDLFSRAENTSNSYTTHHASNPAAVTDEATNVVEFDDDMRRNMQISIQGMDPNGLLADRRLQAQMSEYV